MFRTKITRARFTYSPFTSEQMVTIGQALTDSIKDRIHRGEDANDAPAKPLKPGRNGKRGYPDYKIARGLQAIRDWFWTGRTLRSLKVLSANENKVTIGFSDDHADMVAHVQNGRDRMFGVSPKNREAVEAAVSEQLRAKMPVEFKKVA